MSEATNASNDDDYISKLIDLQLPFNQQRCVMFGYEWTQLGFMASFLLLIPTILLYVFHRFLAADETLPAPRTQKTEIIVTIVMIWLGSGVYAYLNDADFDYLTAATISLLFEWILFSTIWSDLVWAIKFAFEQKKRQREDAERAARELSAKERRLKRNEIRSA